jgi:hypothetical protein
MFRGWFGKKTPGLTGVPAVRRLKTYSAESGYVYQYHFEGRRTGTEFVFSASADRKTWREVTVRIPEGDLTVRERRLTLTDRYAVAKIALFAAFDRCGSPDQMPQPVEVNAHELEEVADRLGW